jgi:hypothetical protein
MFFSRNIALIKEKGPKLLTSLGFKVLGSDWYGLDFRGGTVCFIVERDGVLYQCWLKGWFGEVEVDSYKVTSPVRSDEKLTI